IFQEENMGDGSLSQDEIDALLQGADDMLSTSSAAPAMDMPQKAGLLSPVEKDVLAELLNSTMQTVVPSLAGYLGRDIVISNAVVEIKSQDAVRNDIKKKCIQLPIDYSGGFNGKNLIIFNFADAEVISSLMMGDDSGARPAELTEAHQSTIQEFVNQMLSSVATGFSNRFGRSINTSQPVLSIVGKASDLQLPPGRDLVKITYNINVEGLINSKFYHIMELQLAAELAKVKGSAGGASQQAMQTHSYDALESAGQQVGINPVKFPPLGESVPYGAGSNISLLMDVPMTLTVELGRTRQLVRDILGLGEGSIIELDKLAGEPVDLLVNGKLIAKGEVVVIDENFGVRVTDIVSPAERLNKVQ
ncbi:MAG: flagellar motor switch protein FliN, partial [Spirochaetes bacterium]|nr:flagellar motor switch protein FliN [Spirochaetota bacterium]